MKISRFLVLCGCLFALPQCSKPKELLYNELKYESVEGLPFFKDPATNQGFTGLAKDVNKQGKLIAEYPMKNGKFHGTITEYYPDGKPKSKTDFVNGERHGNNIEWKENGEIYNQRVYDRDRIASETPGAK